MKIIDSSILFKLHDTLGFPIDTSARTVYERGYDINWYGFVAEAEKSGWTFDKTIDTILEHTKREPVEIYRAICVCCAMAFNHLRAERKKNLQKSS